MEDCVREWSSFCSDFGSDLGNYDGRRCFLVSQGTGAKQGGTRISSFSGIFASGDPGTLWQMFLALFFASIFYIIFAADICGISRHVSLHIYGI
jgi:hypothetical protein